VQIWVEEVGNGTRTAKDEIRWEDESGVNDASATGREDRRIVVWCRLSAKLSGSRGVRQQTADSRKVTEDGELHAALLTAKG